MVSPRTGSIHTNAPAASSRSTIVDRDVEKDASVKANIVRGGEGESAVPEDKRVEALGALFILLVNLFSDLATIVERLDHDWQHDPINPRNWPSWRKWTMAAIVCPYLCIEAFG